MCRWASLPLSLVGCINLVKVVILPKFLYLFQHIPICMNNSFFTGFNSLLCSFLWGNKPARLKKSILQLLKAKRGLALPSFRQYYGPATSMNFSFGTGISTLDNCPPWVHMETSSMKITLYSVVCSQLSLVVNRVSDNPVVTSTLKIWVQFRKHHGFHRCSIHRCSIHMHISFFFFC